MLIAFDSVNLHLTLYSKDLDKYLCIKTFTIAQLVTKTHWKLPKCVTKEKKLFILKIE